jgi:hypothetical protein
MCTLTIDEIDDVLEQEINAKAETLGISPAETVKRILTDALLTSKIDKRRKMFAPFLGIWTDKDASEFEAATRDMETIDQGDWA